MSKGKTIISPGFGAMMRLFLMRFFTGGLLLLIQRNMKNQSIVSLNKY
jgi:hypothetical protein